MGESKNIFLAIALSLMVMLGYEYFYLGPKYEAAQQAAEQAQQNQDAIPTLDADNVAGAAPAPVEATPLTVDDAIASTERVRIETPEVFGSLSLTGLRIDDLSLIKHFDVQDEASRENIRLFFPYGSDGAYYAQFGWASSATNRAPGPNTIWAADGELLTPETPVTFSWDNGEGLKYLTKISVDNRFMFTVEQSVMNTGTGDVALAPYGLISRKGIPETAQLAIQHEGPIGVFNGELEEKSYDDLEDDGDFTAKSMNGGWLGITDKYWMSILVPDANASIREAGFKRRGNGIARHDASYIENTLIVPAGGSLENVTHLFAGAKEVNAVDDYAEMYNVTMFDRSIDWGWLYWLTRPIFFGVDFFNGLTGNFGVAILLLTVVIKLILFPIANKGYRSMSRMKKVSPQIKKLQERYKEDKPKLQQEMMALYKKEKINPLSGCLPILIQIPVFFALYKVLYVTIDMRHQPFFGWITDLSAPDPLTPINLFGLLPFEPWSFIAIGIWPILMGLTMWLQQKMNPSTMEPAQQKIMMMLPIIFTFILAGFPAGLVIYWTWNSVLSMLQQWVIMRKEGVAISD